jgi:hypothetical protein
LYVGYFYRDFVWNESRLKFSTEISNFTAVVSLRAVVYRELILASRKCVRSSAGVRVQTRVIMTDILSAAIGIPVSWNSLKLVTHFSFGRLNVLRNFR